MENCSYKKSFTHPLITDLVQEHAKSTPDRPAFTFLENGEKEAGHLSFKLLDMKAKSIANRLRNGASVLPERALLLYPQGLDFILAFIGCLYAGVVAVPVNFLDSNRFARNIERFQVIVKDAKADTVLTTSQVIKNIDKNIHITTHLATLQWIATDKITASQTFSDGSFSPASIQPDDLAFLQYTSGSTSLPKGVMISHLNILDNCYQFQQRAENTPNSCMVNWLPHVHDMGLIVGILQSIFTGMHCVHMAPFSFVRKPYRWLKAISDYRGTISCAPNFAYEHCIEKISEKQISTLDLSSWQVALSGAEPIYLDTLKRFAEKFSPAGFRYKAFFPGYGLAEATVAVTTSLKMRGPIVLNVDKKSLGMGKVVPLPMDAKSGSYIVGCGKSFPGHHLIIVNPDTRRQSAVDEVGEIWIQCGGSMPGGYWNRLEESEETYNVYLADSGEGPYLRTGDLGFVKDGELYFTGRMKDILIIRGVNYFPQDIELTVRKSHSRLAQGNCAVFSVLVGKEERMVIVKELRDNPQKVDTGDVIESIRCKVSEEHELGPYAIVIVKPGSILKTSSGKIQRQACKADYLDGQLPIVDIWHSRQSPTKDKLPSNTKQTKNMPPTEIEHWLISWVSGKLGLKPELIEAGKSFVYYGLDSVMAMEMTEDLSTLLNQPLSADSVYNYPSIASLSQWLGEKDKPASTNTKTVFPVSRLPDKDRTDLEPIAIVGMACRFPGANNISDYWDLLASGKHAVGEVPAHRWDIDAYYDPTGKTPGTMNTRWGGFLDDVDLFDARFFDISPEEAAAMDPQQRLFMEISWEALEQAGQVNSDLAGSATGVFAGVSLYDYSRLRSKANLNLYMGTGNAQCIIANRVSYFLGLQGPSMAIDTACSSSLVSVHLAMKSLRNLECDMALAGGVNLVLDPETSVVFSQADFLSPTGCCKTFDAQADGYIRSEGCGVVVLKRYADAIQNKDNILAVLRGSAINQDGYSNGLTAPNGLAQQSVIRNALADAVVSPQDISYIEAHGTGTPLGDPIETNAMEAVFANDRSPYHPLWIGSVKTNIGHAEAAAGIAGLIKVVLSLQHRQIPPHLHLKKLNPQISLDKMNGIIPQIKEPWSVNGGQRCAGVSSFGFGGTNAHIIISEAPASGKSQDAIKDRPFHFFTLSALTKNALYASARQYKAFLETYPHTKTGDICYTVNTGRRSFPHRLATCVSSNDELKAYLEDVLQGGALPEHVQGSTPKIAFLFTGQGSQYSGMGKQFYEAQPAFRKAMAECDQIIRKELDIPVSTILFKGDDYLNQAVYIQPALFALEYALSRMWMSWGVVPQAVMGHSLGEYVAACVAGILSPEDGIRLVLARSRLMQNLPQNGKMATIFASPEIVNNRIASFTESVSVAAFNGPEHVVISGEHGKVDKLVDIFTEQNIASWYLDVSHGFHSPLMDPILDEFEKIAATISYNQANIPFVSNLSGDFIGDRICNADYWRNHLRNSVRFASGIKTLHENNYTLFLEIGPRPVLSGMVAQCLPESNHMLLASLKQEVPDWQQTIKTLSALYLRGIPLNFNLLDQGYDYKRISLPTYPFERQSYWINTSQSGPRPTLPSSALSTEISRPLLGSRIRTPLNQIIYETRFEHDQNLIREHLVYNSEVMSGSTYIGMLLEVLADTSMETTSCLENIVVQAPMPVPENESRTVQLVLDQQNVFQVFSYDQTRDAWTLHQSGQIGNNRGTSVEKYEESIEAIRSRCRNTLDTKSLYAKIGEAGLQLGPQFQWMEKIWYNNKEALVLMREPRPEDLIHNYIIHPGLIDSCAQSLSAGADFDNDAAYMFLGYDTYRFLGLPTQRLWCHTRFKEKDKEIMSGDYDLFTEDRTLVATARGLYAKRAPAKAFFSSGLQTDDHFFHQIEWIEQSVPENHEPENVAQKETWIIFTDSSSLSESFLDALETEKINDIRVVPGTDYIRQNGSSYQLNPSDPEHFQRLFSETGEWQNILYMWGQGENFPDTLTETGLKKALSLCCGGLLHLIQAIGDTGTPSAGHLWCITRNAHPFTDHNGISNPVNPVQTSLWGLARVVENEVGRIHTHLIDLSPETFNQQTDSLINEIRRQTDENQVAFRSGKRFVPRLVPAKPSPEDKAEFYPEPNQVYLITGGAGSLGQMLMEWLVQNGAKHFVLVGRSDLTESLGNRIQALKQEGVDISFFKADVTRFEEIRTILDDIPELGGIFHLAGTLDDGILLQKDWAAFEKVMAPKTLGAWNLHLLTQERKTPFLVLFSSITSLAGMPGQGNYAAANAFMDGLAFYRQHKDLSGISINWGPWADVGMAATQDEAYWIQGGMQLIPSKSGFDLMKRILENDGRQVAIVSADWKRFAENVLRRPVYPMMSQLISQGPVKQYKTTPLPEETAVLSEIQNAKDADKQDVVLAYIRRQVKQIVWLDPGKQLDPDAPLMNMGFDSLKILELRNRIRQDLKTDLSLSEMIKDASIFNLSQAIAARFGVIQSDTPELPQLIPDDARKYEPFPLTDVQHAYWIGRDKSFELGNNACHVYLEADFKEIHLKRLNRALNQLVAHHDMLRAIVLPDGQQQILKNVPAYDINVLDLREAEDPLVDQAIETIRSQMAQQIIPADQWPLFEIRATLFKDGCTRLHISFDLLIGDGGTFNILIGDLYKLYNDKEVEPITISFRDYVIAEKSLQETDSYRQSLAYWANRSLPEAPHLPLAKNPRKIETPKFVRWHTRLEKAEWDRLRERGTQAGLTPSMILLAAFAEILRYWSRFPEFTIVLSLFNRMPLHPEVDNLAGDFTSLILLAVTEKENSSFEERAQMLQQQLWNDMEHRIVSGVQVLRQMSQMNNSAAMTFPVVFTSALPYSDGEATNIFDHIPVEIVYCISQTPQVWIDHQVTEKDGELVLLWDVVEELFPKGVLDAMFNMYVSLLRRLIQHPSSWQQTRFDLLPESQLAIREAVNVTQAPVCDQLLHAMFFDQADRNPDREALITSKKRMTYRELALRAEQIGQHLQSHNIQPDDLIAVVMDKGWEQVVAVLGILWSGAAYLPIDASMPKARLDRILENGHVKIVLTQSWCQEKNDWPDAVQCLAVDQIGFSPERMPLQLVQKSTDLAYVIYTSGSTGDPKGVMTDHRGAVNTISDINRRFDINPKDRLLGLADLSFDLSVYDIFGILGAGGTLVIPDAAHVKDPTHWLEWMEKEAITLWNSVPQLMQMLIESVSGQNNLLPDSLRLLLLSGDWIPLDLPEKIFARFPNAQVISLGGATEASIWSILYPIHHVDPQWKSIPYGRPMDNQQFYVLNKHMQPCPDWVTGDLYIGGIGLAKGYRLDEEKTRQSFVTHPVTRMPLYKTGDLGRSLPDGTIEFQGREDLQVKIRGYRIELGEVEAALNTCPGIERSLVTVKCASNNEDYLVGYLVLEKGAVFSESDVKQYLEQKIPIYMIPAFYQVVEQFPLSENGKIDHKLLPTPDNMKAPKPDEEAVPENEMEQMVLRILCEAAELGHISVKTNFFDAGINSLHLVRFRSRIKEKLKRDLDMVDLFKYANIRSLSEYFSRNERKKVNLHQADKIADVRNARRRQKRQAAQSRSVAV